MDSFDRNFIELEIAQRQEQADRNRFHQSQVKPNKKVETKINKKSKDVDKENLKQRKKTIKLLGSSGRALFQSPISGMLFGRR